MGGCGTRFYKNISREQINKALDALKIFGAAVAGNNPWIVDTGFHGLKFCGAWNPQTLNAELTITDSDGSIPCNLIWGYIDNLIKKYGN